MHPFYTRVWCLLLACLPLSGFSQNVEAVDDTLCIPRGGSINLNVTANDIFPPTIQPIVFLTEPSSCFGLEPNGQLYFLPDAGDCCGEHTLFYRIENCQQPGKCFATVHIEVKCPKPDCFLVDLADFTGDSLGNGSGGGHPGGAPPCISACENSTATYFIQYDPNSTYTWAVSGGTFVAGANPAEIIVTWGAAGSGSVGLTITNANNETKVIEVCVDILPAPVASFAPSAACVCKNAPLNFINNSIGGSSYYWDFGDGNTSTMFQPTHQYAGPGTYTVTLTVTNANYDPDGNPLCCCTDTMSLEVMVDSLGGPNIYCISTLCSGDSSKYWTDATNCGTYNWAVLDANGAPTVTFTGQGNDTICVYWGSGPVGTITLDVSACDSVYCSKPVSVQVPIISPTVGIGGLTAVCENETAVYSVPKWMSVLYNWQVSGGTILSGQGTHTIVVQWGAAPGPGQISLNYYSSFLGGLPGHDPDSCGGSAGLTVAIKPRFNVTGPVPPVVCLNSTSSFFATAIPYANYTWTVTPAATFIGQNTNILTVTWDAGPGTYTVTAVPNDTSAYCNNKVTKIIRVIELPEPDSITGPADICPNATYSYFGHSSESGTGFLWTVTGGTPASFTGNPVSVTWNATGPYSLTLQQFQLNAPFCTSDPISLSLTPKVLNGPLVISGPPACVNSVKNYSAAPAQHPDATYLWTISPANAGSVTGGQGTPNIQVQWNNAAGPATLQLTVSLCGNTLSGSLPVVLSAAAVPVITQLGILCPGVPATLDAGPGYVSYSWSGGGNAQTKPITTGGTYLVTVTDGNGCTAIGSYQAVPLPGPVASISTGNPTVLCITPPNSNTVTITAQTGAGYTFAWYCNGTFQSSLPPTQATFVHTNTNVVATFNYWVVVTDANGCTNQSNIITVVQTDSCGGGCTPAAYFLTYSATNQTPNCNTVNFNVTKTPNVTLLGWNFGDPGSNANTGTLTNAVHTYTKAGCFLTTLTAQVPSTNLPGSFCTVTRTRTVCVPLAVDFIWAANCQTVSFTNLVTFQPGQGPVSWLWSFGDSNTSTAPNPTHTYASPGTYTVTLTVTNAGGCQASYSKQVTVAGLPAPAVAVNPSPVCVSVPVSFTGSGANIISWLWSFPDDGATNGSQNPAHTFLTSGTYTVTLAVADNFGCTNTVSVPVTVFPAPAPAAIAVSPATTVCAGTPVTLTAPAGSGYTYLWSNNATTPSITVTASGTYSVIVTDGNGCTMTPAPVTITVLPAPTASISGPAFICDAGCITLNASTGLGYTYQWLENTSTPIPGANAATLSVCDNNLQSPYGVIVTDANGCSATSALHAVALAVSPAFTIAISPDSCEGTPATLTIVPVQPNVVYSWSGGATGTSITVTQAGVYTAVGVDTLTGCSGSASATIHPLPDLCLVPAGCYKTCDPDTICGPDGLAAYQWNLNGAPIAGATNQCLIVTQSGAYSLTGTTQFGCSLTSDSLVLEVMSCDCGQLAVQAEPVDTGGCCWALQYTNPNDNLYGLVIHTNDADLQFDLASLDPALSVFSLGTNTISLVNSAVNTALPSGALNDFVVFCLSNVQNTPQQIIFDWYDLEFNVFCSDTIELDCPVEPECLYLQSDSIRCENGAVTLTLTFCNPIDNPFPVGYIDLDPLSPTGVVLTPPAIDLTANPIAPGDCRDVTVVLSGAGIEGQQFCFTLMAHDFDPAEVDTALCCAIDTTYCIEIPDCDPCDKVGVDRVSALASGDGHDGVCCYRLTLFNNYAAGYFNGISLCSLSPNTTLTVSNPFGSGWVTTAYSPTQVTFAVAPPLGAALPLGNVALPDICITTTSAPAQLIEVKWMQGDSVVCRDTVALNCEPPCGYVAEESVQCDPAAGTWQWSGVIKNTSAYTMGEAHLVFTAPAGMAGYNQTIPLGALLPGTTAPFNATLGAPAQAGDTVCFTVALHALNDNNQHTQCCNFSGCMVLPPCDLLAADQITLYPNPSTGQVYLNFPSERTGAMEVAAVGARGGTVARWSFDDLKGARVIQLDMGEIPAGLYFIEIKSAGKTAVKKVVIANGQR